MANKLRPIHPGEILKDELETLGLSANAFAKELAARYSPVVGCTRSWDTSDSTRFQVY